MRAAVYRDVSKVRVHISVSVDGYVAGPDQTLQNPLGEGREGVREGVGGIQLIG